MNPKSNDPVKPVGIGLRASLLAKAKVKAQLGGRSVSDYVRRLIEADLACEVATETGAPVIEATRGNSQLVNLLIPHEFLAAIDETIRTRGVDRAWWLRDAAWDKLKRENPAAMQRLTLAGGAR